MGTKCVYCSEYRLRLRKVNDEKSGRERLRFLNFFHHIATQRSLIEFHTDAASCVILPVALYKVNTRDRLYNAVSTRALIGDAATEPLQC